MLYLLRHTKPDIQPNICYGWTDLDLDPLFKTEHLPAVLSKFENSRKQNLITEGKKLEFQKIYSSPLQRCRILATEVAIAVGYQKEIIESDLLKEINFGDWEMKSWDEIYSYPQGKRWFDNYMNERTPNGESFMDLEERLRRFLAEIGDESKNNDVLVVTHAGAIRAIMLILGRIKRTEIFETKLAYGELCQDIPQQYLP